MGVELHFWEGVGGCRVALLGRGGCVLRWYEYPLLVFRLRELTCMHCVYLAL